MLRHQKNSDNKKAVIEYMQSKICAFSNSDNVPAEQIKGMNRLLKAVMDCENEYFED